MGGFGTVQFPNCSVDGSVLSVTTFATNRVRMMAVPVTMPSGGMLSPRIGSVSTGPQ